MMVKALCCNYSWLFTPCVIAFDSQKECYAIQADRKQN